MTDKLGTGLELDYFHFNPAGPSSELYSAGAWVTYDFTSKFGIALRGEFLSDPDGGGLKGIKVGGRDNSAITSTEADGNLSSLTLTFNFRPTPNIKIQPEVRYDHTSYDGGFDGKTDRIIVGAGVSYLF